MLRMAADTVFPTWVRASHYLLIFFVELSVTSTQFLYFVLDVFISLGKDLGEVKLLTYEDFEQIPVGEEVSK